MKSIALILFNQKKAFENIGNEFSDKLHRKSILLFGIYGMVKFFFSFSQDDKQNEFYINFLFLVISIGISILMMTSLGLLIFWIGKKLKGVAEYIDIESTVAHSFISIIIGLFSVMILKNLIPLELNWNHVDLRNAILLISWLIFIKINIQGSMKFNNFSFGKSLATVSPIILISIGFQMLYFLIK